MERLYRIVWVDENGNMGHGEYCLPRESAISWLSYLRKKYPTMTHQLEGQPPQPSSWNASASEPVQALGQAQVSGQRPLVG